MNTVKVTPLRPENTVEYRPPQRKALSRLPYRFRLRVERTLSRLRDWISLYLPEHIATTKMFEISYFEVQAVLMEHGLAVESFTGESPKTVVIGHGDMKKLIKELPETGIYAAWDCRKIWGMNIVLVPWIDGVFLLPDLEWKELG